MSAFRVKQLLHRREVAIVAFRKTNELPENRIAVENVGIAEDEKMLTGTCEGYVELAVYQLAVFHEGVGGKKLKLMGPRDGEAVEDIVALAALKALHRVDGDGA